ncbi:MAG: NapC/NirT family cytochrome c [Phycisphaerae bacterium]|nr:NapC/NirT family cytochrome c [Phycisphaerae bacterium]
MAKKIRCIIGWGCGVIRRMSWPARIGAVVAPMALFTFAAVEITGQSWFCNSCHVMNEHYESWQASSHSEIACLKCHTEPGVMNYARAKINGLAQTVDCLVGRVGTKANGYVPDASCLRSGCHDAEKLIETPVEFGSVKFTHAKHINQIVSGIKIECGTCHSHFEGNEHFNVNSDVCFTCHFLTKTSTGKRLVQTDCRSCHEVPDKVIQRGMVNVNHAEFVSYDVSCDNSCHKGQIENHSRVDENSCLMCHSFRATAHPMDSTSLHALHSGSHQKVECFACHGKVAHARTESGSVTAMMQCTNCHSDTHSIQGGIYTAEHHPQGTDDNRVLGPMYLTHVACTDCHVGAEPIKTGGIASIGKVARALPEACDKCHEKGTGDKYVPFWQNQIKKLHSQVTSRLGSLRARFEAQADGGKKEELARRIAEVQTLLDTVAADGSWGVHNLKYTEALLMKAGDIINQAQ